MIDQTQTQRPKIAILGAGSIGCYLGGCLAAANAEVVLIGRPRVQRQIEQCGLRVTDWRGRNVRIAANNIAFSTSSSSLANADYILVTVKSGDTAEAAQSIAKDTQGSAIVISFQNGVRNAAVLQQYLPGYTVLKGMVPFNVIGSNGCFHCGTEGDLALEDKTGCADLLVEQFKKAELPITQYDDILGIQWSKLLMNLNNAVNALSGIALRDQLNNKVYRKVMAEVVKEALTVFKVVGIQPVRTGKVIPALLPYILSLPTWLFKRVASAMLKMDPQARSSMYEDLHLRRKTEIDYLNGEIVSLARKHNLLVPVNSAIVSLIKRAEIENAGSPGMDAHALLQFINNSHRVKENSTSAE